MKVRTHLKRARPVPLDLMCGKKKTGLPPAFSGNPKDQRKAGV
jgi:hypothetical protein